jgi:DNA-binding CsgD family transcriptional regulator
VPSLRAAYHTLSRLGAVPLRTEIEALARRGSLDLAPRTETGSPSRQPVSPLAELGLTAREEEVLGLIATGRTNRQIAQSLFISPKTANAHVSNIFMKLGVTNRVEAALIAHRLALSSGPRSAGS